MTDSVGYFRLTYMDVLQSAVARAGSVWPRIERRWRGERRGGRSIFIYLSFLPQTFSWSSQLFANFDQSRMAASLDSALMSVLPLQTLTRHCFSSQIAVDVSPEGLAN